MIKSVFVALAITNWSDPHYGIAPFNFGKDFKCAFWPAERAIEINEKTEVINVPLSAFFEKHILIFGATNEIDIATFGYGCVNVAPRYIGFKPELSASRDAHGCFDPSVLMDVYIFENFFGNQYTAITSANDGWRLPAVFKLCVELKGHLAWRGLSGDFNLLWLNSDNPQVGSNLRFANVPRYAYGFLSGFVSFSDLHEIKYQKKSTDPDGDCGIQRVIPHVSGGLLNRLCGGVHAFLGGKIRYLPLAGFFFAALAGIGGGIILDNLNRERRRNVWAYWALLLTSLPTGAICLLLGLP